MKKLTLFIAVLLLSPAVTQAMEYSRFRDFSTAVSNYVQDLDNPALRRAVVVKYEKIAPTDRENADRVLAETLGVTADDLRDVFDVQMRDAEVPAEQRITSSTEEYEKEPV